MFWWICGLHVEREWMLVWISSLRMAAAIHHQVDPSRILQSIVIPSLYNRKKIETKAPAYTSPQQSTRLSFPSSLSLHFPKKGFWTFNVETFPPTHQQSRFGMSRQEQEDLGEASNNAKDQYPQPQWDWEWLQKIGNVPKGNVQSWNICIF